MKAVYKCLSIDLQYEVDESDYHGFLSKWKRVNGPFYSRPDPLFDAWLLVSGRQRNAFDEDRFRVVYPLIDIEISSVRDLCKIRRFRNDDGIFDGAGWIGGGEDAQQPYE